MESTDINYDIPPPPTDEVFPNFESAQETIRVFTKEHGYALSKLRSKTIDGQIVKVDYQCDRGKRKTPRVSEETRKRKRQTKRLGCPFSATVGLIKKKGGWVIRVKDARHNHAPSSVENLTSHRRHDLITHVDEIRRQIFDGVRPTHILELLKEKDPQVSLCLQDIYNQRKSLSNEGHIIPLAGEDGDNDPDNSYEEKIFQVQYSMDETVSGLTALMRDDLDGKMITENSVLERYRLLQEYEDLKAKLVSFKELRRQQKMEEKSKVRQMERELYALKRSLKEKDKIIADLHSERALLRTQHKEATDSLRSISTVLNSLKDNYDPS